MVNQDFDYYPLYVEFQHRMRDLALTTCVTATAREHYGKVFTPTPRERFEMQLRQMSGRQRRHMTELWRRGFDAWHRTQIRDFGKKDGGFSADCSQMDEETLI